LRLGTLLLLSIGAAVLAIGIGMSAVGGAGVLAWYQCVASSGPGCTASGNNQYYTVFLANEDVLNVGLNLLFVGVLILLAGIVVWYIPISGDRLRAPVNQVRLCPKCGAQVEASHKFCAVCGNNLGYAGQ
jgi:hypothetical protein